MEAIALRVLVVVGVGLLLRRGGRGAEGAAADVRRDVVHLIGCDAEELVEGGSQVVGGEGGRWQVHQNVDDVLDEDELQQTRLPIEACHLGLCTVEVADVESELGDEVDHRLAARTPHPRHNKATPDHEVSVLVALGLLAAHRGDGSFDDGT